MRQRYLLIVSALAIAGLGCSGGGGGGGGATFATQARAFGFVRGDVPTTLGVELANPFAEEAVLELVEPSRAGSSRARSRFRPW